MPPRPPTEAELQQQKFFTALAQQDYDKQTGYTTSDILRPILDEFPLKLNAYSVINDNGCGPGTATKVLLDWYTAHDILPAEIIATDSNEDMITALNEIKAKDSHAWRRVEAKVLDSHKLGYPDEHFTHAFCNFSVFTFREPLKCLNEMHRTLKHRGYGIVTCWKRFGVANVIHAAQKAVKPDAKLMPVAGEEFMAENYLAASAVLAQWEPGKILVREKKEVVTGEKLNHIVDFMSGPLTGAARIGWTDEEQAKWPAAVKTAIEEETKEHGGLLMEAYVMIAQKWDKMSA